MTSTNLFWRSCGKLVQTEPDGDLHRDHQGPCRLVHVEKTVVLALLRIHAQAFPPLIRLLSDFVWIRRSFADKRCDGILNS